MTFALSKLELTSPAFNSGSAIPEIHTGDGEDVSPALAWRNLPQGARSLALFCHDPDAPLLDARGGYGFVHWVLYNIPASVSMLQQGATEYAQGQNNFDRTGYNGPKPPRGHGCHHYYFWLLALDMAPGLPDGLELADLLEKVEPHTVGMNRLVGRYEGA